MTVVKPAYLQKIGLPASRDRQILELKFGKGFEGIVNESDLVVTAPGGLVTPVGAGHLLVVDDTAADRGVYETYNDAAWNVNHVPDGTNPRINTIIGRIYDSTTQAGVTQDIGAIEMIPGTPTAAANLTNLNGIASLAGLQNVVPLYYVHVPAGATNLTTANLLDKRPRKRGVSVIAGSESVAATAYATMPTPDRVPNVVVPANSLLVISYQATWQETNSNNGRALIYIGANPLKVFTIGTAAAVDMTAAQMGGTAAIDKMLATNGIGFTNDSGSTAYTGDAATGQVLNGTPIYMVMPAGTYDISVQFKVQITGSVSAKNRNLRVWTERFV